MDFADALAEAAEDTKASAKKKCWYRQLIELDPKLAAQVMNALKKGDHSVPVIQTALGKSGHKVSQTSLRTHRAGGCNSCEGL